MQEVIPSSLQIFAQPTAVVSIGKFLYEKVHTKTALATNTSQVEFTVPKDNLHYTDLKDSFLMIKCKYVKADLTAIGATPDVGPIQNPLTSIFKSMDMWINDKKVTRNEDNMHYQNFLNLFTQSQAAKDTYLSTSLWVDDTYTSLATANQSDPQAVANTNKGLKQRTTAFKSSREVVLIGRIFLPLHTCDHLLLPNLKFDYRFDLAPFEFFTMSSAAAGTYVFKITEAAMLIKRVDVSPSVKMAHATLLNTRNALYPCRQMSTRAFNIAQGSFDFIFSNAFMANEMPVAVFIMFVKSSASAGSLTENPYVFYNLNLQELVCKIGPRKIPAIDYKLNPGQDQTQVALWQTYMALDYFGSNSGPGNLNRDTFENGAFIMGFDLSRDGNPNAPYNNSDFGSNDLSIQGTFGVATGDAYKLLAIGLFDAQLEINKYYQPFTSWG